jgi:hypothetical protein
MKVIAWLFVLTGFALGYLYPAYHWFQHDALTSMQMLKLFWLHYLVGHLMFIPGYVFLEATK